MLVYLCFSHMDDDDQNFHIFRVLGSLHTHRTVFRSLNNIINLNLKRYLVLENLLGIDMPFYYASLYLISTLYLHGRAVEERTQTHNKWDSFPLINFNTQTHTKPGTEGIEDTTGCWQTYYSLFGVTFLTVIYMLWAHMQRKGTYRYPKGDFRTPVKRLLNSYWNTIAYDPVRMNSKVLLVCSDNRIIKNNWHSLKKHDL